MSSLLRLITNWLGIRTTHHAAPPAVDESEDLLVPQVSHGRVHTGEALYAAPIPAQFPVELEIKPEHDFHAEGLPPDWWARRQAVLDRDEVQCQVTGCINTTGLDVHHIKPRFDGPDHRISNLVTLCRLHHALLPFHRRAAQNFKSERYTGVSAHWRWNIFRTKRFPVRAQIRRFQRAALSDLVRIKEMYGLACECGNEDLRAKVNERAQTVRVRCPQCQRLWIFERGLHEEIAVQMASVLAVTRNERSFPFDVEHLDVRKPARGYACLDCARNGEVVIMEKISGARGRFWGCPNWNGDKRHYKRPWQNGDL
jgi:hypothetical protein